MPGNYPDKIRSLPLFDGRFDAYKLAATGADILFASYPAGTSIPTHTHDSDNYGVIIRGELILHMDGKIQRFGVGDWYHVPAQAKHAASFEVETDEVELWFKPESQTHSSLP